VLAPGSLRDVPIVTYFHENQLTYPLPSESQRDYQYGFTNITTCLASDEVWFNSAYHRDEFFVEAEALLARMPDFIPRGVTERIAARSRIVHPGVDVPPVPDAPRRRPYSILWNHRWEWDKNPEEFFAALRAGRQAGCDFRLVVAGERPESIIGLFARQVRLIWLAKEFRKAGLGPAEIASRLKVPPLYVGEYVGAAERLDADRLLELHHLLAELDRGVKTGRVPAALALELFAARAAT